MSFIGIRRRLQSGIDKTCPTCQQSLPDNLPATHTFQTRLRYFRLSFGLTIDDVKNAVDAHIDNPKMRVSRATVANYERSYSPRAEWLAALLLAYPDTRLDWWLGGEGPMLRPDSQAAD